MPATPGISSQTVHSGRGYVVPMQHHHTHPLHVRIGHWINAVTLFALLWTGFAMLASNRHFSNRTSR